jgi:hypothetical protein
MVVPLARFAVELPSAGAELVGLGVEAWLWPPFDSCSRSVWLVLAFSETLAAALESTCPLPWAETDVWLEPETEVSDVAEVWAAALQVMSVDASATTKNLLLISLLLKIRN